MGRSHVSRSSTRMALERPLAASFSQAATKGRFEVEEPLATAGDALAQPVLVEVVPRLCRIWVADHLRERGSAGAPRREVGHDPVLGAGGTPRPADHGPGGRVSLRP